MGFGKPAIVPKHSAFLDYAFDGDYDLLVESHESISFGVNDAPEGLYTCDERWGNPNLPALASKMRQAYTSIKDLTSSDRVKNRIEYVKDVFSYKAVGTKLKEEISATK
jgi:hypothetical protein